MNTAAKEEEEEEEGKEKNIYLLECGTSITILFDFMNMFTQTFCTLNKPCLLSMY